MVSAIFNQNQILVRILILTSVGAVNYWNHCKKNIPWWSHHPANTFKSSKREKLIPLSFHGDEIIIPQHGRRGGVMPCMVFWPDSRSGSFEQIFFHLLHSRSLLHWRHIYWILQTPGGMLDIDMWPCSALKLCVVCQRLPVCLFVFARWPKMGVWEGWIA